MSMPCCPCMRQVQPSAAKETKRNKTHVEREMGTDQQSSGAVVCRHVHINPIGFEQERYSAYMVKLAGVHQCGGTRCILLVDIDCGGREQLPHAVILAFLACR